MATLEAFYTYLEENIRWVILIMVIGSIVLYGVIKKVKQKKAQKEELQKKLEAIKKEKGQAGPVSFNTIYLEPDLVKANFLPEDGLSYLKKRKESIEKEIKENTELKQKAKERYEKAKQDMKESCEIGLSLKNIIAKQEEDLSYYNNKIKEEEDINGRDTTFG